MVWEVNKIHKREQGPQFIPAMPNSDKFPQLRSFAALPRLDFMGWFTRADYNLIHKTNESLQQGGSLEEIGRGGDMVAYSRPDLDFIIKFPYDDSSLEPISFNARISYGYSLAKEYLRGIFIPSTDVYGIFIDSERREHGVLTIVQRKVRIVREVFRELFLQGRWEEILKIKQGFIELSQEMWGRGVFDADTDWEENYGFLPNGRLVPIDAGYLLDDPKAFSLYEGMSRTPQYEADIRDNFTEANFRRFFGKTPYARVRSPSPREGIDDEYGWRLK